jgi:hypothetical protein
LKLERCFERRAQAIIGRVQPGLGAVFAAATLRYVKTLAGSP